MQTFVYRQNHSRYSNIAAYFLKLKMKGMSIVESTAFKNAIFHPKIKN